MPSRFWANVFKRLDINLIACGSQEPKQLYADTVETGTQVAIALLADIVFYHLTKLYIYIYIYKHIRIQLYKLRWARKHVRIRLIT